MTSPSDPTASPLTKPETYPVTETSRKPLLKVWLLIFAVVVACLLLYGLKDRVAWAQRADEPEAYALLIVEKQDSRFPFDKQEKETELDFDRYLHTQVVNLRNRQTLNRALNRVHKTASLPSFKNNSDDLAWLEKNLGVTIVENTSILRVSLRGGNFEDNAAIVEGVIDAYLEETAEEESKQREKRLNRLREMAARCDKDLSDQRERLNTLAKVANGEDRVDRASLKRATEQSLKEDHDAYRKEHLRIKMALTTAKCTLDGKLKSLSMNGPKPDRAEQISKLKEEISLLEVLEKQLDAAKVSLQEQINVFRHDSPDALVPGKNIDLMATEQMLNRAITAKLEMEMEMKYKIPRVRVLQSVIVAKAN
jgi:hypothetical protein